MSNALLWQDDTPEIRPLATIEHLLSWTPSVEEARYCCSIPLPKRRDGGLRADRPRMLCCHDMRGGYLEDRFLQGGGDGGGYFFRHYEKIDGFVYFSHKLVTIPPPGWTHAGHVHGVPTLGTFITEWEEGAEACAAFLASDATAEHAARQLAAIAAFFNFDGWVINIENDVPPSLIPRLLHFLETLTAAVHAALHNRGAVIWYDAVTIEGKLTWQNALTPLNSPFLDACNGIWLNYTWSESAPGEACTAAGGRKYDVYMGIDAFGRGTYGGGGFNCNVALEAAKKNDVSVALFACAWPYEKHQVVCNEFDNEPSKCLQDDNGTGKEAEFREANYTSSTPNSAINHSKSRKLTAWQVRDDEFWKLIQKAWGLRRATLCSTPFYSDFNTGIGTGLTHAGHSIYPASWYNLRLQSLQPTIGFLGKRPTGVHARITTAASYNGGSSIHLSGNLHHAVSVKLFRAAAPVSGQGIRVRFTAAVSRGVKLSVCLRLRKIYSKEQHQERSEGISDNSSGSGEELLIKLICNTLTPGGGSSSDTGILTPAPPKSPSASSTSSGPPIILQKLSNQTLTIPFTWLPSEDNPNISAGNKYSNTLSSTMLPREWSTWQFSISPGDVLAQGWDLARSALASIEVTASPKVSGAGCPCQVYIGAIAVWGMHEEHKAPPTCSSVEELVVEDVAVKRLLIASGGTAAVLSARLRWNAASGNSTSNRAHVWVRVGTYNKKAKEMQDNMFRSSPTAARAAAAAPTATGSSHTSGGAELSRPQWVGISCGSAFALSNFVLPEGAEFVRVYIATSAWSFSQLLRLATAVTIPLPFGVTSPKHLHTL
jgi:endo-beta-N-acetylglucosaminidase D